MQLDWASLSLVLESHLGLIPDSADEYLSEISLFSK